MLSEDSSRTNFQNDVFQRQKGQWGKFNISVSLLNLMMGCSQSPI